MDFVKELLRVRDAIFPTTPGRFFPFETHTRLPLIHWLPESIFDSLARRLGERTDYRYLYAPTGAYGVA